MEEKFILAKIGNLEIDITGNSYKLLNILISYADKQGKCYPSIRTIEEKYLIARNTIFRSIEELKAKGIITVTKRESGRGNNIYQIQPQYLVTRQTFEKEKLDLFDYDWLNDEGKI